MNYWEHKRDLYVNLEQYPSPTYSPEKFGELVDFNVNNLFHDEETNNNVYTSQKINVRGFKEGQILMWNAIGFNILQAIMTHPQAP